MLSHDLFPRKLPTQTKTLQYFTRALASTIRSFRSFSATERAKHPARLAVPEGGKLYPDELLSSSAANSDHNPLSSRNQVIEYWIDAAEANGGHYNTSNGDLADATKALIAANEMATLLMLAQHPKVPLGDLRHLSWGHSFGLNYVATAALAAYIFFNVLDAMPTDPGCRQLHSYRWIRRSVTQSGDYDAHTIPYCRFLRTAGFDDRKQGEEFDPMADRAALRDYVSMCFAMLYRYDMLVRECGLVPKWEESTIFTPNEIWYFKLDQLEVGG